MWLSYIIPLYNCGEYIAQCLDSVLTQGLNDDDYEVIVVNDGSTDNGPSIVSEYCRKYSQIKLVNQANSGVGSARNRGLDAAVGDYVYFIDADDWLYKGGMEVLRENYMCGNAADIVMLKCAFVDKYYNKESDKLVNNVIAEFSTSQEYLSRCICPGTCWACVISRKVITDNNIKFTKHIVCEDGLFMLRLFAIRNLIIMKTNLNIYRYRMRPESTMHCNSGYHAKLFIEHIIDATKIEKEYIDRHSLILVQRQCMTAAQWYVIARLLVSALSCKEMKNILIEARKEKIYPIENPQSKYHKLINRLYRHHVLIYMLSIPMRILYPLHKKYYNCRESRMPTLKELLSLLKK